MKQALKLLQANPQVAIATVADGKPENRAFMVLTIKDSQVYFATGAGKKVYQQLQAVPHVAITTTSPERISLRISGDVSFIDDVAEKSALLEKNPSIKGIFKSGDNPELKIFCLTQGHGEVFDMTKMPPERRFFEF